MKVSGRQHLGKGISAGTGCWSCSTRSAHGVPDPVGSIFTEIVVCRDATGLSYEHTASGEGTTLSLVRDWLEHPPASHPRILGARKVLGKKTAVVSAAVMLKTQLKNWVVNGY